MESSVVEKDAGAWRRRMLVLVPLVAFLALAALFVLRLGAGDPSRIPSALIGRPAPRTDLPPLPGLERDGKAVPGLNSAEFQGRVTVLNVWASWCVPCREEAALLMTVAADPRVNVVGMNYKDQPDNARRFLAETRHREGTRPPIIIALRLSRARRTSSTADIARRRKRK